MLVPPSRHGARAASGWGPRDPPPRRRAPPSGGGGEGDERHRPRSLTERRALSPPPGTRHAPPFCWGGPTPPGPAPHAPAPPPPAGPSTGTPRAGGSRRAQAAPPPHLRLPCGRREAPAAGAACTWLHGAAPPVLPRARIRVAAPLNGGAAWSLQRAAAGGGAGAAPHWLCRERDALPLAAAVPGLARLACRRRRRKRGAEP